MAMPAINTELLAINLEKLSPEAAEMTHSVLARIIKKNGTIRATKPKVDESDPLSGISAYVWRLVAFSVSTNTNHHCRPIIAHFDLPAFDETGEWKSTIASEMVKDLAPVENAITNSVPRKQWAGVHAWARAYGY